MGLFGDGLSLQGDVAADASQKKIKNALQHPMKAAKAQLGADTLALQTDPLSLGLSDPERQKRIAEATQQATAQQQASISALNQSALGGQGFQAGEFNQAAQDQANKVANATAQATVGVNNLNDQLINSEKQRIFGEMDAARARKAETANFWRQLGIDAVAGLIGFAVGGPAGAGVGLSMVGGSGDSTGSSFQTGMDGAATTPAPTAPVMP